MNESMGLKVLYVDDDRINTLLFVETCRPDAQLQVATAASGNEALAAAGDQGFDVLVIDLHLPDTDGLRLLAALREFNHLRQTPAFLCTAERLEDVLEPAARAGFVSVWIKPVELAAIRAEMSAAAALVMRDQATPNHRTEGAT